MLLLFQSDSIIYSFTQGVTLGYVQVGLTARPC